MTAQARTGAGPADGRDVVLRVSNLHKSYGDVKVLDGVSFSAKRGEVVCLLGRSGSGKSTMLRCINHLERPSDGLIRVDGDIMGYREKGGKLYELHPRHLARQRRKIGLVFQSFALFPHLTVLENVVEAPRRVLGLNRAACLEIARHRLEEMGLDHRRDAYPRELSGGQQQRVAIARAVAMNPSLMLFDEPTSALDPELVSEVLDAMIRLAETGMTMVVVTHELSFARNVGTTALFFDGGGIIESGPASSVIGNPQQPATQVFVRSML